MIRLVGHPLLQKPVEKVVTIPIIVRVTDFDAESVGVFRANIDQAIRQSQPVIPVIVDSLGGDIYGLMAMIDIIEAAKKFAVVATIAEGKAQSSGAILLTCGTENYRFVGRNATVMVHNVSGGVRGKASDMKTETSHVVGLDSKAMKLLDKNCGQKPGYFKDLVNGRGGGDWYMSPADTVKHGLADKIGTPVYQVSVDVSFAFG